MRKFGLIGYPLGHSFSKGYFTEKFIKENLNDCEYNNYPITRVEDLITLIENNPDLVGLNVTIPYKEQVIPLLDELDDVAFQIGAVNTIGIERKPGQICLKGYNTDYFGFEESLKPFLKSHHNKSLILGTGGASKAVAFVFKKYQIQYKYVSRSPKDNQVYSYSQVTPETIKKCHVIVNTTPLGMFPDIHSFPDIPYDFLTKDHILFDLIYNPQKTSFLQKGEIKKAIIINGMPMLLFQAEKAWEIWNA
jgi:shikimate dehydrogenase